MPAQYRGTAHLSFLQNIPWVAVFDLFDIASKEDGLYYACNETTDGPRANIRTLDDFNEVSPDTFVLTRGTTWISSNKETQRGDWIKGSKDCLHRTLFAYKQAFAPGKLVCIFLGLSENAVEEMADIMESCLSILGNSAGNCLTVISENVMVAEALIKASKLSLRKEIRECNVAGIKWVVFKEIVCEMVGPSKFDEKGASTDLPFYHGGYKMVLNKVINSWEDLEVYSPNPRLPRSADTIEKERYAFYKGAQANQLNLFHEHSITRTPENEIIEKVDRALKSLWKVENSGETNCHVKTITVPYEPGSGATTLCRRILWKKRTQYRCAVVKAITTSTDYYIDKLQSIVYDEKNSNCSLPVLVLVDNFPESDAHHLTERIMKRQTKCVVLKTFSVTKSTSISRFELTTLRKLDETETSLVKDILINITSDTLKRREVEEVLERERRFIWFGLELFGRDYLKIEDRLQNHISSILMDSLGIHETLLNVCCFLYKYSEGSAILPHSIVMDLLYYSRTRTKEELSHTKDVHEIFGGLLLEEQDETNGYHGWRPAHSLVSEVVMSRISKVEVTVNILETICKCQTYVVKFVRQQVFKLLLERKRISDPVLEEPGRDDGSHGSDLEDDVFGVSEVRTKYSPVIEEILVKESNTAGALKILITICEQAVQKERKSYAWQQLARFLGYQMDANKMNECSELTKRLHNVMKLEMESDLLPMPRTGIDAAHIAVDIAIKLQPGYSVNYGTKGGLYNLQLSKLEERTNLNLLPGLIEICRKALAVCDVAALKESLGQKHYSMIGKIQATVSLLKIVKGLPHFNSEEESLTRFPQTGNLPREMTQFLSLNDQQYLQGLSSNTLDLLNELFGNVKLKQTTTYDEHEIKALNNTKIIASRLRRTFYKITGYDRRQLSEESSIPLSLATKAEPSSIQQRVQDILFIHDETPYSAWSNLKDGQVTSIYNLLKPICQRGYGNHNDLLICSKACLQLKERPPVKELEEIVSKWVKKFPSSEWAHLFNYMIHFPVPNGSLALHIQSTKESIKQCDIIVREKAGLGLRKSGAEYFLGKGRGLNAIVSSQEFRWLERPWKTKTDFWRSQETTEKLERVKGQKEVAFKGVITYQGIQIHFDNSLYPKESKDDLWFYIGFSLAGPYAYDPVDNDTYTIISRSAEGNTSVSVLYPSSGVSITRTKPGSSGPLGSGKPRLPANSLKPVTFVNVAPTGSSQTEMATTLTPISSSSSRDGETLHEAKTVSNLGESISSFALDNVPSRSLYSSALQHGAKNQVCKGATSQDSGLAPKKSDKWKAVHGTRGAFKKLFDPIHVDSRGRLHHGACVFGLPKTKECMKHKGPQSGATTCCTFAHSWKSDTLQFVCTKCTNKGMAICQEKIGHEKFVWDLGPYLTADGTIWRDSSSSK